MLHRRSLQKRQTVGESANRSLRGTTSAYFTDADGGKDSLGLSEGALMRSEKPDELAGLNVYDIDVNDAVDALTFRR